MTNKKDCSVPNPMNTRKNKDLVFGHSITHSRRYQQSVDIPKAKCEHDRLVQKMNTRNINHNSPFKTKRKQRKK